jgi:hypothetical protein
MWLVVLQFMVGEGELQQDLIVKQMIKLVQLATALMS